MANPADRPLVWLHGEVKTPPFGEAARLEAGFLLRRLQQGEMLSLPHSRPMPAVGPRCHELRITDADKTWRIMYHLEPDAVVILDVFSKEDGGNAESHTRHLPEASGHVPAGRSWKGVAR